MHVDDFKPGEVVRVSPNCRPTENYRHWLGALCVVIGPERTYPASGFVQLRNIVTGEEEGWRPSVLERPDEDQ